MRQNGVLNAKNYAPISLVLLLGCVPFGASYAQEQTAQPPQEQSVPQADAAQAPEPTVQKFDDWFYRCVEVPTGEADKTTKQCEVAQIQQVMQGDQPVTVLSIAIALTAPEKAGAKPDLLMTSVAPLNVNLPAGISYSINGKDALKVEYRNCNQAGCWAQQKLDAKSLAVLKKGSEGEGHFRLVDGRNVNIKFSLKGLTAALDALEKGATK
ncbi:invasion associated locus B family protein [Bartonella apihabitans]|uniref:invasion associated locus B family protein n=1 Tax=Bartonella apihabitans TaxID=2750929 RepID=UPI001CECBE4B|nr:invasion associated locus B family protein [Bartonella apihabitans]